jgi:hypothetical protein
VALRNAIPQFRLAVVAVINRWKHHVLKMPTERAIFHTNIHPWDVYAAHVLTVWELQNGVMRLLKVGQVPRVVHILGLVVILDRLLLHPEPISKLIRVQVSSILYSLVWPSLVLYHVPILVFKVWENFFVVIPLEVCLLSLSKFGYFLELRKCVSF